MGDILHALPAVTALRARHPEWFIGWAVEPQWRGLLAGEGADVRGAAMPLVDALHIVLAKDWARRPLSPSTIEQIRQTRRELRAARYDICLDLQGAVRSAVLGKWAHPRRLLGEDKPREWAARYLFDEHIATQGTHVIEQAVEVANAVTRENLPLMLPCLPVSERAERNCNTKLAAFGGKPFVILNPGAGWGAKRWPTERFGEVARTCADKGYGAVINSGPGEEMLAAEVCSASGNTAMSLSPTLDELIALTRRASLVIAGDTGPLHLASALGKPVVGIFGPTDPARNGPFGGKFRILRHPESKRDHTRRAEPEAGLLTISAAEVSSAAMELLEDVR
ncbi:glycosyltransferase family 9 protein [Alloacidobacterium dinghuense]|uniref:Glycosyltransferase family 9 protein n=2 Tax=Alloacidobacterium dinghuense TaxID=2763107 RepID=A0A7G8BQH2_9BACT|nr:glycosyltransferase family 9 protein [Alloacidobacterium dinghuense]